MLWVLSSAGSRIPIQDHFYLIIMESYMKHKQNL